MAAFNQLHILLSDIEHELNVLISNQYISRHYLRIQKLKNLRKELLKILKLERV